jgi:hypothetical protein
VAQVEAIAIKDSPAEPDSNRVEHLECRISNVNRSVAIAQFDLCLGWNY